MNQAPYPSLAILLLPKLLHCSHISPFFSYISPHLIHDSAMVAIKLTVASFLASAIVTSAFPHYAIQDVKDLDALGKTVDDILKRADIPKLHREARANSLKKRQSTWSPSQLVDVTGEHRFIAPTSSQTRGPCPGELFGRLKFDAEADPVCRQDSTS